MQQVLLQLCLSLARRHAAPSIFSWLSRVARNECLDHLRRQQPVPFADLGWGEEEGERSPLHLLRDPGPLPEDLAERHEGYLHLEAAVAALAARQIPPGRISALVCRIELREIARMLDIPESTAKTRYHRAKRLLHTILSAEVEAPLTSPR